MRPYWTIEPLNFMVQRCCRGRTRRFALRDGRVVDLVRVSSCTSLGAFTRYAHLLPRYVSLVHAKRSSVLDVSYETTAAAAAARRACCHSAHKWSTGLPYVKHLQGMTISGRVLMCACKIFDN